VKAQLFSGASAAAVGLCLTVADGREALPV